MLKLKLLLEIDLPIPVDESTEAEVLAWLGNVLYDKPLPAENPFKGCNIDTFGFEQVTCELNEVKDQFSDAEIKEQASELTTTS